MRLTLLFALFFIHPCFATNWSDLEIDKFYQLNQSIQLTQEERSHSILELGKGDKFKLTKIIPLIYSHTTVNLYVLNYLNCPGPDLKTRMEIIPVNETSPSVEIGVQVENCELLVFLELNDIYNNSLFQ